MSTWLPFAGAMALTWAILVLAFLAGSGTDGEPEPTLKQGLAAPLLYTAIMIGTLFVLGVPFVLLFGLGANL